MDAEKQVEKLKQLQRDYTHIFASEEGKRVLADLCNKYHIDDTTFRPDGIGLAYQEGQRTVVLHIKRMLELTEQKIKELTDAGS